MFKALCVVVTLGVVAIVGLYLTGFVDSSVSVSDKGTQTLQQGLDAAKTQVHEATAPNN